MSSVILPSEIPLIELLSRLPLRSGIHSLRMMASCKMKSLYPLYGKGYGSDITRL